jgi:hypothetical protein
MNMDDKTLYSGTAVGGPLDGQTVEGRFPSGIVFVSKIQTSAWIYDYNEDEGKFYVRPVGFDAFWDEMDSQQKAEVFDETVLAGIDPARELDEEKIVAAAEGSTYEVRALPDEDGGE